MIEKILLPVINYIYRFTQKIDDKIRKCLIGLFVFILLFSIYIYQLDEFLGFVTPAIVNAILGFICFTCIVLLGISSRIESINVNKLPLYLLMICGMIIFCSGFHHYIGYSYMLMGLFMTFLVPTFVVVWSQNINCLLRITACINIVLFVCFFIINCVIAPAGDPMYMVSDRYFGIASDPNGMAKISVSAVVCSIYLLLDASKRIRYVLLPVLSMAIALIYLTISRTNMIALALVVIFSLIIVIKNMLMCKVEYKRELLSLFAVCLVVAMLIPCALKCCEIGYYQDTSDIGNNYTSESQTSAHADSVVNRAIQGVAEDGTIDYNNASSGRITIWKYCIDNLSATGESPKDGIMVDLKIDHVHNTVLEITYRSGIFAGGCFLLLEVLCCIWIIRTVISRKKILSQEIFGVLSITAFGIASLFDIVVLPFAKITVLLFYISLPVMMNAERS